jgi:uncharacterized protein (DUF983 family)
MTDCNLDDEVPPAASWAPRARQDVVRAMRRGASGHFPHCGRGRLFAAYLKQVERCPACGEDYSETRADDGPAWLTILIVGHIVVAAVLIEESLGLWPVWLSMSVFPLLAVALSLLLLPVAKGAFIGMIWATKAAEMRSS